MGDAASFVRLKLLALKHCGQGAAAVDACDTLYGFNSARIFRYVRDIFTSKTLMDTLPGDLSIGYLCYSTVDAKHSATPDVQPFLMKFQLAALQMRIILCAYFTGQYPVASSDMLNKGFALGAA